jgi:putative oxidoreductase
MMDAGLLVARVATGLLMAAHGSQKLFGSFGGYGLTATSGFFEKLGFRPGRVFAAAAGSSEFVAGLLLVAGFLGPIGPALMFSVMIVAALSVHWQNGLFAGTNGIEVPLLYAIAAAALALTGPGRFSLDAAAGLSHFWTPVESVLALALGALAAVANLAARRHPEGVRA